MMQKPARHPARAATLRTRVSQLLLLLATSLLGGASPALAQAPAEAVPSYKPDSRFLREEPFRKTKQVVQLNGVQSDAELATVRSAINDVVSFVRLFGITGSNLGSATVSGSAPEQMAEIKAARITWKAFEDQSTPKGRQSMPLEPASGHIATALDTGLVETGSALSVRVDFRQTFYELKMVQDPPARILRLRFVKQGGQWLFDGVTAPGG